MSICNAVLQREESEGIGIEELDTLQLELETLLAAVSRRMRQLESETKVLVDWQEKKDVKKGGKPVSLLSYKFVNFELLSFISNLACEGKSSLLCYFHD